METIRQTKGHTQRKRQAYGESQMDSTDLLFKVPPIFVINQNQVQVVPHRELFVDITHRRRQIVAIHEQTNRYRLTFNEVCNTQCIVHTLHYANKNQKLEGALQSAYLCQAKCTHTYTQTKAIS